MQWVYDYNVSITSGNGVDSTATLQTAINNATAAGKGFILTKPYYVKPLSAGGGILNLPSNAYLKFTMNACLRLLPHSSNDYKVLMLQGVSNVFVEDAVIDGNREENTASDPNGTGIGIGIAIYGGSSNVILRPKCINMWSDGWYVSQNASNMTIVSPYVRAARRNGASIISAIGLMVDNPVFERIGTDNSSVAPLAAIDIEPDSNADVLQNVFINGMRCYQCNNGLLFNLNAMVGTQYQTISITVNDFQDFSALTVPLGLDGLDSSTKGKVGGFIQINSPRFHNSNTAQGYGPSPTWDNTVVPVGMSGLQIASNNTQFIQ